VRIARYYAPFVLDDFQFHVTLASGLADAEAVARLGGAITEATGLFGSPEEREWLVDDLWLFEHRPDGFWRLAERFELGG